MPTAKVLTKRQLAALEAEKAKKTPEQIKAEVHEKTKALVADAQQKTRVATDSASAQLMNPAKPKVGAKRAAAESQDSDKGLFGEESDAEDGA